MVQEPIDRAQSANSVQSVLVDCLPIRARKAEIMYLLTAAASRNGEQPKILSTASCRQLDPTRRRTSIAADADSLSPLIVAEIAMP